MLFTLLQFAADKNLNLWRKKVPYLSDFLPVDVRDILSRFLIPPALCPLQRGCDVKADVGFSQFIFIYPQETFLGGEGSLPANDMNTVKEDNARSVVIALRVRTRQKQSAPAIFFVLAMAQEAMSRTISVLLLLVNYSVSPGSPPRWQLPLCPRQRLSGGPSCSPQRTPLIVLPTQIPAVEATFFRTLQY